MKISGMRFEDLEAWKESRLLTKQIYRLCSQNPLSKDFALAQQLRRASVSIMTNLAEGFERVHKAEKIQFWNIARSSAGEVRSLLYVVSDSGQVSKENFEILFEQVNKVSALCKGLIRSYERNN